jgi:hypothetical protein
MTELFGKTKSDKLAEENTTARKIVQEILQYGVSERQKQLILYYLSLELENIDQVQTISSALKEICPEMTITGIYEGNK